MPETALIDWHQLDTVREECGEAIADIFREFVAEYPDHHARFAQALAAQDPRLASKAAHQLKGSSANFGMIALVAAMQEIESEADRGQLPSPPGWRRSKTSSTIPCG